MTNHYLHSLLIIIFLHRSRRAARADESDEDNCDEKEDYASSEDDESATSFDDEDDQVLSDCEVEDSSRPAKPTVHRRYYWTSADRRAGENNSFESVDGTKMFYNRGHGNYLRRETGTVLSKGQKLLIAKQEDEHIIVEPKFSKSSRLTQVPYRKLFFLFLLLFLFLMPFASDITLPTSFLP